jgi:tetratricopeptide (TPR) repeat protein
LELRQPEKAIALLRERRERLPNSQLFLLEVDVLIAARLWPDALSAAEAAIQQVSEGDDDYLLLELLSRAVRLYIKRLQFLDAFHAFDQAKSIARIRRRKLDLAELQQEWLPIPHDLLAYYASSLAEYTINFQSELLSEYHHYFAQLLVAQADAQKELGNFESSNASLLSALEHYENALLLAPNDVESWYGMGNAYLAIGHLCAEEGGTELSIQRYLSAIECFNNGLIRSDEDVECTNNKAMAIWSIADALKELGRMDEAFDNYSSAMLLLERLVFLAPDDYEILCNLGGVHYDLGELGSKKVRRDEYTQAISYFDHALRINPYDRLSWFNKGNAYNAIGEKLEREGDTTLAYAKYEAAVAAYNMAIVEDEPDVDTWANKANTLRSLAGLAAREQLTSNAADFLMKAIAAFDKATHDARAIGTSTIEPLVDAFGCIVIRTHFAYRQREHSPSERTGIMRDLLERLSDILSLDVQQEVLVKILGQQLEIITYYCPDLLSMSDHDKNRLLRDVQQVNSASPQLAEKIVRTVSVLRKERISGLEHFVDQIDKYVALMFRDTSI